jgi:hypothetical protein
MAAMARLLLGDPRAARDDEDRALFFIRRATR